MSQQTNEPRIPSLTLGWRLKMALAFADVTANDMATYLGVSRQTLTRWMNDDTARPPRGQVVAWALRTGVDLGWLERGDGASNGPDGGNSGTPGYVGNLAPIRAA